MIGAQVTSNHSPFLARLELLPVVFFLVVFFFAVVFVLDLFTVLLRGSGMSLPFDVSAYYSTIAVLLLVIRMLHSPFMLNMPGSPAPDVTLRNRASRLGRAPMIVYFAANVSNLLPIEGMRDPFHISA